MTETGAAHPIDFIRLNGQAIRVTSWREGDAPGTYAMVAITRGSRDAELLDELLRQDSLTLDLEGHLPMAVTARDVDRREFGSGQGAVTRFAVTFEERAAGAPEAAPEPPSLEERVAALEADVAQLRIELRGIASRTQAD